MSGAGNRLLRAGRHALAAAGFAAALFAGSAIAQTDPPGDPSSGSGDGPAADAATARRPPVASWDRSKQTDGARPVEARLTYSDPEAKPEEAAPPDPDEPDADDPSGAPVRNVRDDGGDIPLPAEPRCGGGGLAGAMNCVAERIAAGGGGGGGPAVDTGDDITAPDPADPISPIAALEAAETAPEEEKKAAEAKAGILFRPELRVIDGKYEVTLEIGRRRLSIPDDLDAGKRAKITQDSQIAHLRLIRWKRVLTPAEAARFEKERVLRIPVSKPFENLALLRLKEPVAVTVALPGGGTKLRFVELGDRAFVPAKKPLQFNHAYFVEALFEKPPESRYADVTLSWEGGTHKFQMLQTGTNPRLYRSQRFFLREAAAAPAGGDTPPGETR